MKKFLLGIICLFSLNAVAQTDVPLFDLNNQAIIGTEIDQSFSGSPIILIEKTEEKAPEINRAEKLPPPELTQKSVQIPIKTPMGHQNQAVFINHITDIISFIQILDNDTIEIIEQIQFITTKDQTLFRRSFPDIKSENVQILSVLRDQMPVSFTEEMTREGKEVLLGKKLAKGVHRITLRYLLRGFILHDKSLADITIPVLSGMQTDMIE